MINLHFKVGFLVRMIVIIFLNLSIHLTLSAQNTQSGLASYYHDSLEGNKTASGQIFQQNKFTAAHKTLDFGTWVLVQDRQGDDVVVYVNDRLPGRSSRMIDLTVRAAEELHLIKKGLKRVSLKVISARDAWLWYLEHGYLSPDLAWR